MRAVVARWFMDDNYEPQEPFREGLRVQVDLDRLVHRVYVSPSAPLWFVDLAKDVVTKYGYVFEVCQSALDQAPAY